MDKIAINSPLDMHVHFRSGDMLNAVVPLTSKTFAGALVMPNTVPPITNIELFTKYYHEVKRAYGRDKFRAYIALFFQTDYTFDFLQELKGGIISIKFYPKGMTTNSDHGCDPSDKKVLEVLGYMEELEIPLCVHGESPVFVMDRESYFVRDYIRRWCEKFPKLKIILEHVTTSYALEFLNVYENLYATITAHHLLITLDDVIGGMLNPHLFCKPVAKTPSDRKNLVRNITDTFLGTTNKIMLGTDSAPHPIDKKESSCGCAGVFTAPIALQLVAQVFDAAGSDQESMQKFVSDNAVKIYNLTPLQKKVTLVKKPYVIPERYGDVVPMWAGQTIPWSIESIV